jgi:glycosyltransferase involved in cell wall biosynthesis
MRDSINKTAIAFLSTFPPRQCGIATFTLDLATAIDKLDFSDIKTKIIAVNEHKQKPNYTNGILYQIDNKKIEDYVEAAKLVNGSEDIKAVSIQHEFKLYGSDYGENLLLFLKAIKKPVVTTFHAVLPYPSHQRKYIVQAIAKKSDIVVVMSKVAVEILSRDYFVPKAKIKLIPHGIHDVSYEFNKNYRRELSFEDKTILMSFGLLRQSDKRKSSSRGYEYVIDALPEIIKKFPNALYLIAGTTHPASLIREGEAYREFLENKVRELGLGKYVKFVNKYITNGELFAYLKAADVYVSSSLNPDQITSGTLSYAMGCGCAVVSTPFTHAKDLINGNNGILLDDFKNSNLFSAAIIKLLSNNQLREKISRNAYYDTRHMLWSRVAMSYATLFNKISSQSIPSIEATISGKTIAASP